MTDSEERAGECDDHTEETSQQWFGDRHRGSQGTCCTYGDLNCEPDIRCSHAQLIGILALTLPQGTGEDNLGIYVKSIVRGGPAEMVRVKRFPALALDNGNSRGSFSLGLRSLTCRRSLSPLCAERGLSSRGPAAQCGRSKPGRPLPREVTAVHVLRTLVGLDCTNTSTSVRCLLCVLVKGLKSG